MAALVLAPLVAVGALFALPVLLGGLVVIVGLLVVRQVLGARIELAGMRCRRCESTYANGSPFFTDEDANPRHLTVADVPRPLGSSPYTRGKSVEAP